MRDFRMELHAIPAARVVRERGHRNAVRFRGDSETRRRFGDVVAVAHPHVQAWRRARLVFQAIEQPVLRDQLHFGVTELALI